MPITFNSAWRPTQFDVGGGQDMQTYYQGAPGYEDAFQKYAGTNSVANGGQGVSMAGAFGGIDNLSGASRNSDGTYTLTREDPNTSGYVYKATVKVNPDGTVSDPAWKKHDIRSTASMVTEGAALAALAAGGLGGMGFFGAPGAAGGLSGMDLAGDAITGGNSITGAGAALGGETGGGLLSGMDLAGDAITGGNSITGAGAALGGGASAGSGLLGSIVKAVVNNPRLASAVVGGILGGTGGQTGGGGDTYKGPMPTITRGGWQPSVTPTYQAQPQGGLLPVKRGQANSGLWRFIKG